MTAQGNGILHYWNLIIANMPYHHNDTAFLFLLIWDTKVLTYMPMNMIPGL